MIKFNYILILDFKNKKECRFSSYLFHRFIILIVIIIALFLEIRVLLLLCLDFVDIAVVCLFDVCLLGPFSEYFQAAQL